MLTRCSNQRSKTPISMRDANKDAIGMAARRERLLEAGFRLMSDELEAIKRMILDSLTGGRRL